MYWRVKSLTQKVLVFCLSFLAGKGMIPFRSFMGGGKRQTISRAFVENFVHTNASLICGDILEIGRNVYKGLVSSESISSYSCLDISPFPDVDIIADIQNMPHVESEKFDTIICTQVLEHVPNPFDAIDEIYRVLRPGGVLLITVPFLNNYHMEPNDYWRFTEYGLKNLLKKFTSVAVSSHGSTFHHVAATLGFRASEVDLNILERTGAPKFPVIVSAIAQR